MLCSYNSESSGTYKPKVQTTGSKEMIVSWVSKGFCDLKIKKVQEKMAFTGVKWLNGEISYSWPFKGVAKYNYKDSLHWHTSVRIRAERRTNASQVQVFPTVWRGRKDKISEDVKVAGQQEDSWSRNAQQLPMDEYNITSLDLVQTQKVSLQMKCFNKVHKLSAIWAVGKSCLSPCWWQLLPHNPNVA